MELELAQFFSHSFSFSDGQWTFFSATSFLEKCRKVVLEKWFFRFGFFFFWSTTFLQPEKMWIYIIKPPFFLVNHFPRTRFLEPDFSNQISRTTFLEPFFYNFLEKWLQKKWSNRPVNLHPLFLKIGHPTF